MPIHIEYDHKKNKHYIQWGDQKRYYFNIASVRSFKTALKKCQDQAKAIYANGWTGN